ncbi:hypothetical protein EJ03DRAFT_334590 [Teratosphaeria nubilosa]|uniref:Uncharacterized protein n=1 Tax=Teratosphaeria nubilosa TaxID=161662 RepID=A0A6G1LFJ4_9PEZI|nr:hypothetical protein EJ03DRAFT_334590 [Teratosphaeria nubilosa]
MHQQKDAKRASTSSTHSYRGFIIHRLPVPSLTGFKDMPKRVRYCEPTCSDMRSPAAGSYAPWDVQTDRGPYASSAAREATPDDMPSLDNDCDTVSESDLSCTNHTELISTASSVTSSRDDDPMRPIGSAQSSSVMARVRKLVQAVTDVAQACEEGESMRRWRESLDDPWFPLNMRTQETEQAKR